MNIFCNEAINTCNEAINTCNEAFKVLNFEDFLIQYVEAKNILGIAYLKLAQVENGNENCKKAQTAFEEALTVSREEEYPEIYQKVENNLRMLGSIKEE